MNLDTVEYEVAFALQRRLVAARAVDAIPDVLVLLEHPPVVTVGRRPGAWRHVLLDREQLAARAIALCETSRGGDVTYHGPGQIVGYPILALRPDGIDLHAYLRRLEEVIMRTLAEYGLASERDPKYTGVWVGRDKIAAIGIAVRRWVTLHGFALNVDPDLSHFDVIVPCGIVGRGVAALAPFLGRPLDRAEVRGRLVRHFADVFDRIVEPVTMGELEEWLGSADEASLAS